ncbi:hypothetical protein AXG93_1598s1020 [Marchantia polymorpha subsp. ruderalis]|uniref:Uncharacterized protein n=1 Tax=Marchantia polymorpha subsp. ruderalis TaxID=1480154 RepID=A0A176W2D9_MARPO|nr:hypothetical protein AXG93_1598s1020 [Marchantia polymorpha subsp. ruderalis]
MAYSTQQAIDWYVTRLSLEMETFCRRSKSDDIEEVIALEEAFKTFMLNRKRKYSRRFGDRERKPKSSRQKQRATTPSSSESLSSLESSKAEDFSSSEDEKPRKKANGKKKNRRMAMPKKRFHVHCIRGDDDDLILDSSVKVTRAEEKSYAALFKNPRIGKNGYRTIGYHDRFRRNVAMALMEILRPFWIMYMITWQVGFVERALQGDQIHWAQIFWTVTRQHMCVLTGGSENNMWQFLINFYSGMGLLTDVEKKFALQTHAQDEEEILSANEVDNDTEDKQIDLP